MNRKLNKRIEMFGAVIIVLNKNKPVWEAIPIFVVLVTEFGNLIGQINETAQVAGIALTGVTDDKNATLDNLTGATYEMALVLSLFARRTGKTDWLAKTDIAESDLDTMRQADVLRFAEDLLALAKNNVTDLAAFGVDAAEVNNLETLATAFSQALPASRASQAEQKAAHEKLASQVAEADQLLRTQLDNFVERLRNKAPDFANEYFNARKVIDTGVRHEKKPENGAPIATEGK